MRALCLHFSLAALLLTAAGEAHAGAWTRAFGEHYVRASGELYEAGSFVDSRDQVFAPGRYTAQQYSLYAEMGILPWYPVQLAFSLPISAANLEFVVPGAINGKHGLASTVRPGDLRLALQTELWTEVIRVAVGPEIKIPLYTNDEIGSEFGQWSDSFPFPGDGQVDVGAWLYAGGSFDRFFVEGGLGWVFRTEAFLGYTTSIAFSDGFAFRLKGGFDLGPAMALVEFDGLKSVDEDAISREYVRIAPMLALTLWRGLAIDVRVGVDLWTRNAPKGLAVGTGVSWRYPYPEDE